MEVKNSGTSLTPNRLTPNKYHATNIACLGCLKVEKLNCKIYILQIYYHGEHNSIAKKVADQAQLTQQCLQLQCS